MEDEKEDDEDENEKSKEGQEEDWWYQDWYLFLPVFNFIKLWIYIPPIIIYLNYI